MGALGEIVIGPDVLEVLGGATVVDGCLKLPGTLPRPLYVATNKVIEALGGRWDRKASGHVFPPTVDIAAVVAEAAGNGRVLDSDKALAFFPTPASVADIVARLAAPRPGMRILEPSAGTGSLVLALRRHAEDNEWEPFVVDVFEIDDGRRAALADMECVGAVHDDFLAGEPKPHACYDLIVANPPFSRKADIPHIERMWQWLKLGGRLVCVVGRSFNGRSDKKSEALREMLGDYRTHALPDGSFSESGTGVSAMVIVATKPAAGVGDV